MSGKEQAAFSVAQGGRGLYIRNRTTLSQLATPETLGESPGAGTGASLFLATNNDHAYDDAILSWYVKQDGRLALFATTTIEPVDNAQQPALVYTQSGFAADGWEVSLTLTGATVPAADLQSALCAFGVEDILNSGDLATSYTQTGLFTGPGQAGSAAFNIPAGASVFVVTLVTTIDSDPATPANVGRSYATSATYAWQSTGLVARLVPVSAVAPFTAFDALMGTMVVPTPSATGADAEVTFVTPTGLDAGAVVRVTVTLLPLAMAT